MMMMMMIKLICLYSNNVAECGIVIRMIFLFFVFFHIFVRCLRRENSIILLFNIFTSNIFLLFLGLGSTIVMWVCGG